MESLMKMIFKHNFIKAIVGGWPLILGLAFILFTHLGSAEETIDEQIYSNLTEQELETATVNLVLAPTHSVITRMALTKR